MKKIYSILAAIFLFAFSCIITFSCCKKKCSDPSNPACGNYDPCYGAAHVTADFTVTDNIEAYNISASNGGFDGYTLPYISYNCDTIWGGSVIFTPKYPDLPNTQYTWYIGADTFHTRKVNLSFSSVKYVTIIPIRLDIKAIPNYKCYPKDDSLVSFTKNITVSDKPSLFDATWIGAFIDSPNVIKTVTIDTASDQYGDKSYKINGLYLHDTICNINYGINSVREFAFRYPDFMDIQTGIVGTMLVDDSYNNITIWNIYTYWGGSGAHIRTLRIFKGHRK